MNQSLPPIGDPPNVSVLITARNEAAYLAQALESLLVQTDGRFEVIVVNDGSTDKTADILNAYATRDPRIVPIHQPTAGRANSLNSAIAHSRGRYLAIMDADDISLPDRLALEVEALNAHPEWAMVTGHYQQIDSAGTVIKTIASLPDASEALATVLQNDNPICHGTVMIRREVMEALQGYRTCFQASLDYDLYLRLTDRYAIGVIPQILYQYRIHGNSISSRRLLQLQMKRLAQTLKAERLASSDGLDSLMRLEGDKAQQNKWITGFLRMDVYQNRMTYAQSLQETGIKYFRLREYGGAASVLAQALRLSPWNLRTLRYWLKAWYFDKRTTSNKMG